MVTTLLNNRYQAIQVIGDGGFGQTFLAEDTYLPSRRRCVIKQLKPVVDNPQMYQMVQERFQREAATLEHLGEGSDQIPKLYAYFSENGLFYLVQEWIQGQTLTQRVEVEGPQSETTVSQILVSLLPVLNYVHSRRIIHRDVKPDNIILRQSNGQPVLIDFGAVKETMGPVVNAQANANQSLVVGTPGFMSPEQAVGRPVYASDIYGLGLTAIYLLTGKQPQELQADPQTGKILWQQAVNVSPNLAEVLDRAIQPYAGDRYTTAQKMLDDLQHPAVKPPLPLATQTATVVVSPKASGGPPPPVVQLPQPAAVINPPAHPNRQKAVVIGVLAGVLAAAAVALALRHQPDSTQVTTSQSSQSPPEPSAATPSEPPSVPTVTPPLATQVPSPDTSPKATQVPSPLAPSPNQDSGNPTETPSPATSASGQDSETNKTGPATASVQTFPTGTARSTVEAALGKPNNDSRGAWGNTRAVLYKNVVPGQVDLGYLYDRDGQIRETEAGFAPTADPQIISTTLNKMLDSGANEKIERALQQVQQGQKNYYTFTQGSLKGMIVRQNCNSIYISVWDADLHDFDTAGAQKC